MYVQDHRIRKFSGSYTLVSGFFADGTPMAEGTACGDLSMLGVDVWFQQINAVATDLS